MIEKSLTNVKLTDVTNYTELQNKMVPSLL
jgi:hypothetical protein